MAGAALTTIITKINNSPLSAFNNFINEISSEINDIFYPNDKTNQMVIKSQIIFEDKTINLFGFIKISYIENQIKFKFSGNLKSEHLNIINVLIKNENSFIELFQKYLFILDSIQENYDSTIQHKYIEIINKKINELNGNKTEIFLIPYKNKIKHLYDKDDKTIENLLTKFCYGINFSKTKNTFSYSLIRLLSSDLDENKSIENIRFLEKDYIKTETLPIAQLQNFLIKLFYYGEF